MQPLQISHPDGHKDRVGVHVVPQTPGRVLDEHRWPVRIELPAFFGTAL